MKVYEALIELETVDSTNDWARRSIETLEDKAVITAEVQTNGKGRKGRTWISDSSENTYLSIVLKPEKPDFICNITQYTGLVVSKTMESYGLTPEIKWPNDILINGKKVCGILCESVFSGENLKGVIIGIGVNINSSKEKLSKIDKPATSLSSELNQQIDKKTFLKKLLEEFFLYYDSYIDEGFSFIKTEYTSRARFIGKEITVDGEKGLAQGITENGELVFRGEDQKERIIHTGDITIC